MLYYSDKQGVQVPFVETVSNESWRGIIALFQRCVRDDSLSHDFPQDCPDGNGISGFDEELFRNTLRSVIPQMEYPFQSIGVDNPFEEPNEKAERLKSEQYAVLDTIEFIYRHLHDVLKDPKQYHEFYHHFELLFIEGNQAKDFFREGVNEIFRRNGIVFELTEEGSIVRVPAPGIAEAVAAVPVVQEPTVSELLSAAVEKYRSPRFEERRIGLERLWDAFERIKTAFRPDLDKKASASELLVAVSGGLEPFRQSLETECKSLTDYGNLYQIRHHEVDKIPIDSSGMLDYLFSRMVSMVSLLLTVFPK